VLNRLLTFSLPLLVTSSFSRPARVCASAVTCGNTGPYLQLDSDYSANGHEIGGRTAHVLGGLDAPGGLNVDPYMAVPGARGIYACGDCAAVPDLTRPGQVCGMTAQHAQRQGKQVARNVAASLGHRTRKEYKHRDLGFLVDLGGLAAAANPLNVPLSGAAANALTRSYHLYSISGNRTRVLADWTPNATTPAEATSFGVISAESVPLDIDNPGP
jgi:NADH dehydrogenase